MEELGLSLPSVPASPVGKAAKGPEEEDLYLRLKRSQRQLEMLEIQVRIDEGRVRCGTQLLEA
jgi:hypothetical protein